MLLYIYFRMWIYNKNLNNFTALPPSLDEDRFAGNVGVFNQNGALKIMINGGDFQKSSEIFDFESSKWQPGPGTV